MERLMGLKCNVDYFKNIKPEQTNNTLILCMPTRWKHCNH